MSRKSVRFSDNNKLTKNAMIPTTTTDCKGNQQSDTMNGREEQKALSVGRSKYSQSRRVELWSRLFAIVEDLPLDQQQANNNIDADTGKSPDDELWQPLLDGGQGKTSNIKCALVIP
jgi:hypothetical protein